MTDKRKKPRKNRFWFPTFAFSAGQIQYRKAQKKQFKDAKIWQRLRANFRHKHGNKG